MCGEKSAGNETFCFSKMRTVHLVGLLFCVSLPLIAGFDLRKIIRTAQCQSSCLRNLTTDDECWNVGQNENRPCQMVIKTCLNHALVLCCKSSNGLPVSSRHEITLDCVIIASGEIPKKTHTWQRFLFS